MLEKAKILIVEDERIVAESIKSRLFTEGYSVLEIIDSGEKTLEFLKIEKPDLILMDIMLSGKLNGIETANEIKKIYDIPLIYLTAYADNDTLEKVKITEPFSYIVKPFQTNELTSNIEIALFKYQSEKKLKNSEKKYRDLVENNPYGIIETDFEGAILYINPAMEKIGGYKSNELINYFIYEITATTVARDKVVKIINDLKNRNEETRTLLWKLLRKDNNIIDVRTDWNVKFDLDNTIIGFQITFIDITLDVEARKEVNKLSNAIKQSPSPVVITDVDGKIEYVNPKFEINTGYSLSEIIGNNPRFLQSGNIKKNTYNELWDTISTGNIWSGEFENITKNGKHFFEKAVISPIFDDNNKIVNYIKVAEDITEIKLLNKRLEQTQKMEAIGQLAAGVAHQLNTPLAVISIRAQILEGKLKNENELYKEQVTNILDNVDRISDIIHKLLNFSRVSSTTKTEENVNDIISEVLALAETERKKHGVIIKTDYSKAIPQILLMKTKIEQVFLNIILNAFYALPLKGELFIKTFVDKDKIIIQFMDNGCGMNKDVKNRIFEPFFTTKEKDKGTGLGLYLCYNLIQEHNGSIFVESEINKGTMFQINLPISD